MINPIVEQYFEEKRDHISPGTTLFTAKCKICGDEIFNTIPDFWNPLIAEMSGDIDPFLRMTFDKMNHLIEKHIEKGKENE